MSGLRRDFCDPVFTLTPRRLALLAASGLIVVPGFILPGATCISHAQAPTTAPTGVSLLGQSKRAPSPLPSPDPHWVRTTSLGVGVELMSVAHRQYAETDSAERPGIDIRKVDSAWTPTGHLLTPPIYPLGIMFSDVRRTKRHRVLEMALRIQGKVDDRTGIEVNGKGFGASCSQAGANLGGGNGETETLYPDLFLWDGSIDTGQQYGSISVQIANGPWTTKAEDANPWTNTGTAVSYANFSAAGQTATAQFSPPFRDGKGRYRLVVSDTIPSALQMRIIAVDRRGREYEVDQPESSREDNTRQTTISIDSAKVPYSQLRCLRLQVRPYETVQFDHVALYPGKEKQ